MRCTVFLICLLTSAVTMAEDPLTEIYNFYRIDDTVVTAGQVTPEQVPLLKQAEISLVVNLATAHEERNGKEGFLVTDQGIGYVQIPVIWDKPTFADLELFFAVMKARQSRSTVVHCFANYRASAFTYLYRVTQLGVPEAEARQALEVIWTEQAWEEYPQWRKFVDDALARYRP